MRERASSTSALQGQATTLGARATPASRSRYLQCGLEHNFIGRGVDSIEKVSWRRKQANVEEERQRSAGALASQWLGGCPLARQAPLRWRPWHNTTGAVEWQAAAAQAQRSVRHCCLVIAAHAPHDGRRMEGRAEGMGRFGRQAAQGTSVQACWMSHAQ